MPIGDPTRLQWTVPIQWSYGWPWLNNMSPKPDVLSLGRRTGMVDGLIGWGEELKRLEERVVRMLYTRVCMKLA